MCTHVIHAYIYIYIEDMLLYIHDYTISTTKQMGNEPDGSHWTSFKYELAAEIRTAGNHSLPNKQRSTWHMEYSYCAEETVLHPSQLAPRHCIEHNVILHTLSQSISLLAVSHWAHPQSTPAGFVSPTRFPTPAFISTHQAKPQESGDTTSNLSHELTINSVMFWLKSWSMRLLSFLTLVFIIIDMVNISFM